MNEKDIQLGERFVELKGKISRLRSSKVNVPELPLLARTFRKLARDFERRMKMDK